MRQIPCWGHDLEVAEMLVGSSDIFRLGWYQFFVPSYLSDISLGYKV